MFLLGLLRRLPEEDLRFTNFPVAALRLAIFPETAETALPLAIFTEALVSTILPL